MIRSGLLLGLCLIAGLALGLGRELLIVSRWGTSGETDALLVALFIPEAIRTTFGAGLISAAATNLWLDHRSKSSASAWLRTQSTAFLIVAISVGALLALASGLVVRVIGPGLSTANASLAGETLGVLVWCLPGVFLHALLSVVHQAEQRFALPGLGSLFFNLPAVLYLVLLKDQATFHNLALALVFGSILMAVVLMPGAWRHGWRPFLPTVQFALVTPLIAKLMPLGLGATASQATVLLERVLGSFLPEGSIAVLNLGRKLLGLPAVAITSLGQIALSRFANEIHSNSSNEAVCILRQSLVRLCIVSFPIALGLSLWAPQAAALILLGGSEKIDSLASVIRFLAIGLIPSGLNVVLARYCYAYGDTRSPTILEFFGIVSQISAALILFSMVGLISLPLASTIGIFTTTLLLLRLAPDGLRKSHWAIVMVAQGGVVLLLSHAVRFPLEMPGWLAIVEGCLLCVVLWSAMWLGARKLRLLG